MIIDKHSNSLERDLGQYDVCLVVAPFPCEPMLYSQLPSYCQQQNHSRYSAVIEFMLTLY